MLNGTKCPVVFRATWKRRILQCFKNGGAVPRLAARLLSLLLSLGIDQPVRASVPQDHPSAEAHVGKGYEYEKDDRFALAAGEFEAALALDPNLPRARYQLGVCYYALGRDVDARSEFERLRIDTHDE